jgi:hypothetical protein
MLEVLGFNLEAELHLMGSAATRRLCGRKTRVSAHSKLWKCIWELEPPCWMQTKASTPVRESCAVVVLRESCSYRREVDRG